MHCCRTNTLTQGTDSFFSAYADKYLKRFQKKGLEKSQKQLFAGLHKKNIQNLSVLEIGCGVGYVHNKLIDQGCSSAIGIDISEGMIEKARSWARELNHADITSYYHGDFVEMGDDIKKQDITILDKVFCCYEDYHELMEKSLKLTDKLYAFTLPRDNWWFKFVFDASIAIMKLFKFSFHPWSHPVARICQYIDQNGFSLIHYDQTFIWKSFVYAKDP